MQYYIGKPVFQPATEKHCFFRLQGEETLLAELFRFEHRDGRTYIAYTKAEEQEGTSEVYAGLLAKDGTLWTIDDPTAETYIEIILDEVMRRMELIRMLDSASEEDKEIFLEMFGEAVDRRMAEVLQE